MLGNKDYYELLEVSKNASLETIKAAYKSMCKKYHPDVSTFDMNTAEAKMKTINEAYDVLSNSFKKHEYDRSISGVSSNDYNRYQQETRAKAQAEAQARATAQAEAQARATAQAEAQARARAKAQAEAQARAKANQREQAEKNNPFEHEKGKIFEETVFTSRSNQIQHSNNIFSIIRRNARAFFLYTCAALFIIAAIALLTVAFQ